MLSWLRTDESFFEPDRPLDCPLLGAEVPVLIYTDSQEIHPNQLDALTQFLQIPAEARAELTPRLFADYESIREVVDEVPDIATPEQVWSFVRWTRVLVPLQGPSGSRFVFVKGDPAWEEEHGVELLFRDERLIYLDRSSGVFLTSHFWSRE